MSQSANTGRIARAFATAKAEGRVALIPYVMSGYPDLATSEAVAVALCEAGADILELGVPFSDPLADGATIQYAAQHALEAARNRGRARLWSAGAATGEEPYSLAIVLAEYFRAHAAVDWRVEASDISHRMLDQAKRGIYPLDARHALPPDLWHGHET